MEVEEPHAGSDVYAVTWMRFFPYCIAGLELGAFVVYLVFREYRMGCIWLFYALATVLFAGVK